MFYYYKDSVRKKGEWETEQTILSHLNFTINTIAQIAQNN